MEKGSLDGLMVVDLTLMLAGPFCTQLLADQGADVLKIEPIAGEMTRTMGPFHADDTQRAFGGYFQSVNRNKKSLALDLKSDAGREVLLQLIDRADVIVENFRTGVMERLDLSYETLQERNPRLVYAAIRGFGDPRTGESPYANWPAFDVVGQAMGGIMGITGPDSNTPIKIGPGVGDLFPGALGAFAIMAAVHRVRETGRGQFVDISMVDSVLALSERIVYQYSYAGEVAVPQGNGHPLICPFGMFASSDGWVTVACPTDAFWSTLCHLMNRPDAATDPRFSSKEARVVSADAVNRLVGDFTKLHSKDELMAILGGKVPFGPVYNSREIFRDPHFKAREMLAEVEVPGRAEPAVIAGSPIRMSESASGVKRRAPLLGEDTDATLESLGFSSHQISDMRARGVVA